MKTEGSSYQPTQPADHKLQTEDSFMKKVNDVLQKNTGNADFSIFHLCYALSMSRTQLYRKFQALSNQSVHSYFRSLRLQKAKHLLEQSDLNVTQIAFEVGFKDLSHFSYVFKKEFGISPGKISKRKL